MLEFRVLGAIEIRQKNNIVRFGGTVQQTLFAALLSDAGTLFTVESLIEEHPPLARAPSKLSFPSAHATSSVAAATALARVYPRRRVPLYCLATAICLTRPYLGMHYPSDVVAGVALGALIGRAVPRLDEPSIEERLIDLVVSRASANADLDGAARTAASTAASQSMPVEDRSPQ